MSLFGAIGRTALKTFNSNNRFALRHSPQTPKYVSNRFLSLGKSSEEEQNKVPEPPKRPASGYNIFYKDIAIKMKAENPGLSVKEMAKTIGHQWTHLDPIVKQEITERTKRESEQYKEDIEKWRKSLNDSQRQTYLLGIRSRRQALAKRRLRVELKRLDYPQRPRSAFIMFMKESLDNREHTEEPHKEVFKRIVIKWKTITPEEKSRFEEMAKNDKIRYLQQINEWEKNIKTEDQKEALGRLAKLRTRSHKSSLNSDLKKAKTKKVVKKPKAKKKLKAKTKTSKKIRAKPKVKTSSKSKSKTKAAKLTAKKSPKPKATEKSKESKAKKNKKGEKSGKENSSDSSDE